VDQLAKKRRPSLWLQLGILIASAGILSVIGAALGHGLAAFAPGDAEAHVVARAPIPSPIAMAEERAPTKPTAAPPAQPTPTQIAQSASLPPTVQGSVAPILSVVPFPDSRLEAVAAPARLPRTAGDEHVLALGSIALALFVIGVVICMTPRIISTNCVEKE
jgi:hypothetical protein